jgi:replication factor C subunit 3/5
MKRSQECLADLDSIRYPFSERQDVMTTDWEAFIADMAKYIIQEQSPKRLMDTRGKLYELLTHCISADIILKVCALIQ